MNTQKNDARISRCFVLLGIVTLCLLACEIPVITVSLGSTPTSTAAPTATLKPSAAATTAPTKPAATPTVAPTKSAAAPTKQVSTPTKTAQDYFKSGSAYLQKEDYAQALADFNKAIQLDPKNGVAYYWRGYLYYKIGEVNLVIDDMSQAIQLAPDLVAQESATLPDHYFYRGYAYLLQGNTDSAIDDLTRYINEFLSEYPFPHEKTLPDGSIEITPVYADDETIFENASYWRGFAYQSKRDYGRAITDYNQVVGGSDFDQSVVRTQRGICYLLQSDIQSGLDDLNEAIRINPGYAKAYLYRGQFYQAIDERDLAIADFRRVLQLTTNASLCTSAQKGLDALGASY